MKKAAVSLRRPWYGTIFLLGLCFFHPACRPSVGSAGTTIPDEKMARILADLNIAEAATTRLNGYPKDSLRDIYFKQVMEMHGVTLQDYETNLRIIVADPARTEKLLKESEDLLQDIPQ